MVLFSLVHFQGDGAGKTRLKNNGSIFSPDFFFEGAKLPDALIPLSVFHT